MITVPADGNHTFALIKPDGVRKDLLVYILRRLEEEAGLTPTLLYRVQLKDYQVRSLYGHVETARPEIWEDMLAEYTSGPSIAMVLQGREPVTDAPERWRRLMGCTRSAQAAPGTIRALFGDYEVVHKNVVHGSDSVEAAVREIGLFS